MKIQFRVATAVRLSFLEAQGEVKTQVEIHASQACSSYHPKAQKNGQKELVRRCFPTEGGGSIPLPGAICRGSSVVERRDQAKDSGLRGNQASLLCLYRGGSRAKRAAPPFLNAISER